MTLYLLFIHTQERIKKNETLTNEYGIILDGLLFVSAIWQTSFALGYLLLKSLTKRFVS